MRRLLKSIGRSRIVQETAGLLIATYLRLVRATNRFVVEPAGFLDDMGPHLPVITAMWHGQHFMIHYAWPKGARIAALISRHGDGEINAIILRHLGVMPIRGSGGKAGKMHRKGAYAATREMLRSLEAGTTLVLTADVPKISRVAGLGIVTLAQHSGRPIYPIAVVTSRRFDFRSWDRASLGKPFGRGAMVLGDPIHVARDADDSALEAARRAVEAGLNRVHARAYALIGAADPGARRGGMNSVHPLLLAYRAAWVLARPLLPLVLKRREARGKEDAARLTERRGIAGLARPPGRLVWLHGASVGEALALLPLVTRLQAQGYVPLVTTGTVTSAKLLAARLPAGALHQYAPLDAGAYMRRFIETWRPALLVLAESELWPNMLLAARRAGVGVMLVNARLSARSFARWSYTRGAIRVLLSSMEACLAQTPADAERLTKLGAPRVSVCGNLKFDAAPLPADAAELADLQSMIGARPCWIAASTHEGEEALALATHVSLAARHADLLTIIAPRHPARADAIAAQAATRGLALAQRSKGERIEARTQIYLADTMGEMGLLYRLSAPVFMGKSLAGARGGQNPIEPAQLGAAIAHGPAVSNFAEVYALLDEAGGAVNVAGDAALADVIDELLRDDVKRDAFGARAKAVAQSQGGACDAIMAALSQFLERQRGAP